MIIDLHIHSTASDGTDSPSEIVQLVEKLQLKAFSLTDHDTIDGNKAVLSIDRPAPPFFLTGVEISSVPPEPFPTSGNFHILGYGFDITDAALNAALEKCQQARKERNPRIIDRLNTLGMTITMEEVLDEAGDGLAGRPHMASVLLKKGYISSIKEAFDKYLAKGCPAFVDKYRIDCKSAIEMIRSAGGVPVLAHPITLDMTRTETEGLIQCLTDFGLMGIEAYYTTHTESDTRFYLELAGKFNLLVTGGSDYHGALKDDIHIGTGKGGLNVPAGLYDAIVNELNHGNTNE